MKFVKFSMANLQKKPGTDILVVKGLVALAVLLLLFLFLFNVRQVRIFLPFAVVLVAVLPVVPTLHVVVAGEFDGEANIPATLQALQNVAHGVTCFFQSLSRNL